MWTCPSFHFILLLLLLLLFLFLFCCRRKWDQEFALWYHNTCARTRTHTHNTNTHSILKLRILFQNDLFIYVKFWKQYSWLSIRRIRHTTQHQVSSLTCLCHRIFDVWPWVMRAHFTHVSPLSTLKKRKCFLNLI